MKVFFVSVNTNSQYVASAGPCAYDLIHNRTNFENTFGPQIRVDSLLAANQWGLVRNYEDFDCRDVASQINPILWRN